MTSLGRSASLGLQLEDGRNPELSVDAPALNTRIKALAAAQSHDIIEHVEAEGVRVIQGRGRLADSRTIMVDGGPGPAGRVQADILLIATGATPRILPDAVPDGERILTWRQIYDLPELPEELIVVGSGVTGAEFAGAYQALGSNVSLVSSRERVLPHEDKDAAVVIEEVFRRRGMNVISKSRAEAVHRKGDGVIVTLADGRTISGSHCLMTVGMIPSTSGIGLRHAGVHRDSQGFVEVDPGSRTAVPGVYAAGECTRVLLLPSVAAMQGRIAMAPALGEAARPITPSHGAPTSFTHPEI